MREKAKRIVDEGKALLLDAETMGQPVPADIDAYEAVRCPFMPAHVLFSLAERSADLDTCTGKHVPQLPRSIAELEAQLEEAKARLAMSEGASQAVVAEYEEVNGKVRWTAPVRSRRAVLP